MSPPARRGRFGAFSGVFETGVAKSTVVDWTGDDTNDREIDLGDDYDVVLVFPRAGHGALAHLCTAYALRDIYGAYIFATVVNAVTHTSGSHGETYWQGKMSGADVNKIQLSKVGNSPYGTNASGVTYRALAVKLA